MGDRIIRGTGAGGDIRIFAADCTAAVKTASRLHNLSLSNSFVLGKMICAALIMGADIKTDKGVITLSTDSDGISGKAVVSVNGKCEVKAYIEKPRQDIEDTGNFKELQHSIDSIVLGKGTLNIIKDLGMRTPYSGRVEMKYGNLAKDLTYYYAVSEQVPTSISLGVLVTNSGRIRKAGGFLVQLLPGCSESSVSKLENNIMSLPNFTDILDMGYSLEKIVEKMILKDLQFQYQGELSPRYKCNCSKFRMKKAARILEKSEIADILKESGHLEVKCHFCNKAYKFYETDFFKDKNL